MKKFSSFKILWHYLKDDKVKLFVYMLLVLLTYLPGLATAIFWGLALEELMGMNLKGFVLYLAIWEGLFIFFYTILQIPRDYLYNYLEIKFMKNVSKDLYRKIDNLPAIAFEEIGVGEFVNRLYNDPDRVMELLQKLIKLLCKGLVIILVFIVSFNISLLLDLKYLYLRLLWGLFLIDFFLKLRKHKKVLKKSQIVT